MSTFFRKLRAVAGIGLIWGALWLGIGLTLGVVFGSLAPESMDPGEEPILISTIFARIGLVSGISFAAVLAFAERRRTLSDLSLPRAAVWGALGTAVFPLLVGLPDQVFVMSPIGAAVAAATVAIARRSARRDPQEPGEPGHLSAGPLADLNGSRDREVEAVF